MDTPTDVGYCFRDVTRDALAVRLNKHVIIWHI
jgi:hypothetical protein